MKYLTSWVGTAALIATMLGMSSTAFAQDNLVNEQSQIDQHEARGVLRAGKLYSFGGGAGLEHGFGLDLRYELYPDGAEDGYLGLFSQGQYELGDAWRFAGGANFGWGVFGLELGVSHRTATADYAGSTGIHIGQSFTFGPVSVGARLTVPVYDHVPQNIVTPMAVQGIEGAVVLRMGWGFQIHGPQQERSRGCHAHGGQRRDPHSSHHGH